MIIKKIAFLFFVLISFLACKQEKTINQAIADIDLDVRIERFDSVFSQATPKDLPILKQEYPFLFSKRVPDSVYVRNMTDSLYQELYAETLKTFKDFKNTKKDILLLFKHLKGQFKEFKVPRIITVVSEVDYRNKVIVTDSIVLVALDTYLGKDHKFYSNIPKYLRQNFTKDQIVSDLAEQYAKKYIYQNQRKTLLDEMIYSGKILYFKDVMLPQETDAQKIGYTPEQLDWAKANESEIWRYFIEKEMLYSTDSQLPARFINPAPFSKFYLELDNESPGKLGQYIGWQIVKSYMEHNDTDLNKMLIMNADKIFKNSKFKPKK